MVLATKSTKDLLGALIGFGTSLLCIGEMAHDHACRCSQVRRSEQKEIKARLRIHICLELARCCILRVATNSHVGQQLGPIAIAVDVAFIQTER